MDERPTEDEALRILWERSQYLTERIRAKKKVGWDASYDERERCALNWALWELSGAADDDAA